MAGKAETKLDLLGDAGLASECWGGLQGSGSGTRSNVTPARTIVPFDSDPMAGEIVDFCIDLAGNIYVATTIELYITPIEILELPGGVTTNVTPLNKISGEALRENHLDDVAGPDVLLGPDNRLLKCDTAYVGDK